jgi:6-phosphofructokinase 1
MKHVGIVTSGGDAPGMNAAIRGLVRLSVLRNLEVIGFERGWEGLLTNEARHLGPRSVGGILNVGGTILHTSRSPQFKQQESLKQAAKTLRDNKIDCLFVIGGNGSFKGAFDLSRHTDTRLIGVPASIDNDVYGTDETIGFDTAVNTAVSEIDKIRDTALSHERTFIVEVMGRARGFLALTVGLNVGAEVILVPEVKIGKREIIRTLRENAEKGKKSSIIVAAEGIGDTRKLAAEIEQSEKTEVRLTVLGYVQRGGSPTARSRTLAFVFAEKAIELLSEDSGNNIVALRGGEVTCVPLEETCKHRKKLDIRLLELAKQLST